TPEAVGRVFAAGPGLVGAHLLSAGGCAYTESVLGKGDAHHRLPGAVALDGRVLPWLGLALRLDGRYDVHVIPGQAHDTELVGNPRVYVRADRALAPGFRVGGRLGLWMPGGDAPSFDAGALSPELVGAASFAPAGAPFTVSANAG